MMLIGFLALIIVAILSQIVLFKGINFLGIIENKYRDGITTDLSSVEEVKDKIVETSANMIKGATINSTGQVEVIGNTGTHLFYLENGCIKCELVKYGFRISRMGRFLGWLKIVPKMRMANEINTIFENISGNIGTSADNKKIIKSVSGKTALTNILAIVSIVLIISSVISVKSGYVDIVKNSVAEGYGITYGEAFDDFFKDGIWESFNSDDGRKIAEFKGTFSLDEEDATAHMQYTVNDKHNTFELSYFTINGEIQDMETYAFLMERVFADNLDETTEAPPEDILSLSTPVLSGFYYVNIPGTDGQCFRTEWSAVEGATGYEIENNQVSVDGSHTQIEETSNLFYEVSGSMEITALVKVRAYMEKEDEERIYSDWSEIKEAKINGGYLEENTTLNWNSMIGEYSDDNMNTIYLQKNGNDFYLAMATYRGGDDLEGALFLEENGTLFYSNGGTRSFSLRIIGKDTIELFDDTWEGNLCGVYTKY